MIQVARATKVALMLVGVTMALPAAAGGEVGQQDVPVKKVVLYSSGVGFFEHTGQVTGDATTELQFKSDQINDVLKSLVLQDLDGGRVGTVVYPSQDPLAKTLRSFQVDISRNPPLGELLNQLRGARVTVAAQGEKLIGTILGLEGKRKPVGDERHVEVWVLNLLEGSAIRSIELADARSIELQDPQLREELAKALSALAQARDQEKKPVEINFLGDGPRRVRVGYVVETPVWKTTYRLIFAGSDSSRAALQGWAIVENQTQGDWNGVTLSLVSGRPISFIQNLYQPLYAPRPVVEPELYASLTPQLYEEGLDREVDEARRFGGVAVAGDDMERLGRKSKRRAPARGRAAKGVAAAPAMMESGSGGGAYATAGGSFDAAASVASLAAATDVGELFQYTVTNVSLPRQRSAMIPIVTEDIGAKRVSIYNAQVLPRHPLNGVLLRNTTEMHLLQGPVTVIDDHSYAGDARIEDLPAGQQRLLSYAVDLDVHVDSTKATNSSTLQTGRLVKGVLYLQRKDVFTQEYLVNNKSDRDRTMLIEHPFRQGWKLVDSPEPFETTDRLYRFKDAVSAGRKSKLTVTEEHVRSESITILAADVGRFQRYARSGEIPKAVRKALGKAIELKGAMVDTQRRIDERKAQIQEITKEQDRIRANMKTVKQSSEYYSRLLKKLSDQETQIESLQSDIRRLQETLDRQRADLEGYLANLNIG